MTRTINLDHYMGFYLIIVEIREGHQFFGNKRKEKDGLLLFVVFLGKDAGLEALIGNNVFSQSNHEPTHL